MDMWVATCRVHGNVILFAPGVLCACVPFFNAASRKINAPAILRGVCMHVHRNTMYTTVQLLDVDAKHRQEWHNRDAGCRMQGGSCLTGFSLSRPGKMHNHNHNVQSCQKKPCTSKSSFTIALSLLCANPHLHVPRHERPHVHSHRAPRIRQATGRQTLSCPLLSPYFSLSPRTFCACSLI